MHSGGWKGGLDDELRPGHIVGTLAEPEWACTLVSIILALNDIGPGDGPTV